MRADLKESLGELTRRRTKKSGSQRSDLNAEAISEKTVSSGQGPVVQRGWSSKLNGGRY